MNSELTLSLLSCLVGCVLTQAIVLVIGYFRRRCEQKNLYKAIAAECRYNLSILDEITNGTVNANGSFKRMSVEFFKTIRQQAVAYSLRKDLLQKLSRVIVDLELFNLEADFVFNENLNQSVFVGDLNKSPICVVKKTIHHDISGTVKAANCGVRGSLKGLLSLIPKKQREEGKENENED